MENQGRLAELPEGFRTTESPFEEEILAALTKKGLLVDCQVGVSKYKLDFAIRDPKTNQYVLAVEADGATYHSSPYARERDWLRQEILEGKGWSFCRIWSTDWWENPAFEVKRVMDAYEDALRDLRKPRKSIERFQLDDEPTEEMMENSEYEVLRGLMAQFPGLLSHELKEKWMSALGLKRRTQNLQDRFAQYYADASKEIKGKRL
jgi:very-short-patch-repair endonuclease